ncbi:MAG: DUF2254 domain-containing protein [Pyrinomonadaceae bacterium]|nr:DUF2254 domain-containing protein [Pyrinomonadaceae bacterium]
MRSRSYTRQLSAWGIPALYAGVAIAAGMTFPRIESRLFPDLVAPMSISSARAIYTAIASGMITLTGIVFSLTFVMVQFSATAYSPRLVLLIARDPVMSHALGMFTGNFLYAIAALVGIDRNGSGKVPFISAWVVVVLLLGSVTMFIVLIHRIGLLQVNQMLIFTGDRGREVINTLYPPMPEAAAVIAPEDFRALPCIQTLVHYGKPCSVQSVDMARLVKLASAADAVIEIAVSVGDTAVESMPLLHVFGAERTIHEPDLRQGIELGGERTFEQDPKYAIRLLVDIAIRALSPAVNDPTTAVQALDQIEDLLLRLGQRHLEIGAFRDQDGNLRLVVSFPAWEDLLGLAFDEICFYGATSVQVMRRMNALIGNLMQMLPQVRRPALAVWEERLKAMIARSFTSDEERIEASKEDRQGLGVPRQRSIGV